MTNLPPALRKALKHTARSLPKALQDAIDGKKHKYGAMRTTCLYGHNHDSRKEAMWCVKLHEYQKEDKIFHLKIEPKYELIVNGILIAVHYPDFSYEIANISGSTDVIWKKCIVDVKGDWEGGKRPEWIIKRKLCEALYPDYEYIVV